MSWWQHAFAVEPAGPLEPTPEQRAVIDAVCRAIVRRQMQLPAILFLEASKPMGPLAAQSLLMMQPWLELVADRRQLDVLAKFLDHRRSFDYLSQRLEELSQQPLAEADGPRPVGT